MEELIYRVSKEPGIKK